MSIVTLRLPEVKSLQAKRPSRCPYCAGEGPGERSAPRMWRRYWCIVIVAASVIGLFLPLLTGEVRQLIHELPIEGDKRLVALYRQLPPSPMHPEGGAYTAFDQLRSVIIRLADNWARFRVFDWQPDVPWTNNPTEQVIGKMKMRARTVRGYKTWPGMTSGLMVAGVGVN